MTGTVTPGEVAGSRQSSIQHPESKTQDPVRVPSSFVNHPQMTQTTRSVALSERPKDRSRTGFARP